MRGWLSRLESHGGRVAAVCALCGMLGLVALTLMTNVDVFMRWLFNSPIDGVADVAPLVVAIVVASFFPFALAGRHHISIRFLGALLTPWARAWLETLVALVTLVFFILLAWQFILYTVELHEIGQTTWVIRMPVAPWWAVVCLFMALCIVVQLVVVMTALGRALGRGVTSEDGSSGRGRS
jgi:TRAP-type C4-dicarboxylate transport system permease small subunit